MIEHLVRLLAKQHKVATLSRGYGRSTRGIRIATPEDNATTIGDEPLQFYRKFGHEITVAVGEERALAIPLILQEREGVQAILLDDAFQHRQVVPQLSILLTDYHRPFYKDFLLPSGRLRESRWSAQRADVVVVTKCPPEISDDEQLEIERHIRDYVEKPVFFTSIRYGDPVPLFGNAARIQGNVALISGIANPTPLKAFVSRNYTLMKHFHYRDHHHYTERDVNSWLDFAHMHRDLSFLTTEKDKVKLETPGLQKMMSGLSVFYLPIEIDFLKGGKDFDEIVLNVVKQTV
jgi:tetraacyldisaccharide 4'-kinase